jgi:SAM-dependent methyltransferase
MTHSFAHPARLRALAVAYGHAEPRLDAFRYLELGCGSGADLLPLAAEFRDATFVGVDDPQALGEAPDAAVACGLGNLQFCSEDELDGTFDFVFVPGSLSRLPADARKARLARIASLLAPGGVALLVYPTLPGASLRSAVRRAFTTPTRQGVSASEAALGARARIVKLLRHAPSASAPHFELLREELARLDGELTVDPRGVLADPLEPLLVGEVIDAAKDAGLAFVCEALPATPDGALELAFVPGLMSEGLSRRDAEVALDVTCNRAARASLFVRGEAEGSPEPRVERLLETGRFAACFGLDVEGFDLSPGVLLTFAASHGTKVESADPYLKAALHELSASWPRGLTADELRTSIVALLEREGIAVDSASVDRELGATLGAVLELVRRRHVELLPWSPTFDEVIDGYPRLRAVTRYELSRGATLTSARHESVALDQVFVTIAAMLDGRHSLEDCIKKFGDLLDVGALKVEGMPATPAERGRALQNLLVGALVRLRNLGVLEPSTAPVEVAPGVGDGSGPAQG